MNLEDFEVGVTLGTGSFGRVKFARFVKEPEKVCAIKMLLKTEIIKLNQVEHIMAEKNVLMQVSEDVKDNAPHPFFVLLFGTFQDAGKLYVVMEFVNGGELFSTLRKEGKLKAKQARFYGGSVVLMFDHLHAADIIYRDLKPENLLVAQDGYLKLTDFGFAKHVLYKTYTLCGTPEYIAPEVLLNKGHGKGVDWWTLGILCYEMVCGQPPFMDDEDPMGIYQQILSGQLHFPRFFDRVSKNFIKKILVADLTKRYGCLRHGSIDLKKHKWFSGFDFDQLYKKLIIPPFMPAVEDVADTTNFDTYPETARDVEPCIEEPNPFAEFDCVVQAK